MRVPQRHRTHRQASTCPHGECAIGTAGTAIPAKSHRLGSSQRVNMLRGRHEEWSPESTTKNSSLRRRATPVLVAGLPPFSCLTVRSTRRPLSNPALELRVVKWVIIHDHPLEIRRRLSQQRLIQRRQTRGYQKWRTGVRGQRLSSIFLRRTAPASSVLPVSRFSLPAVAKDYRRQPCDSMAAIFPTEPERIVTWR